MFIPFAFCVPGDCSWGWDECIPCSEGSIWSSVRKLLCHPAPLPADPDYHQCREELHHHLPPAHWYAQGISEINLPELKNFPIVIIVHGLHLWMMLLPISPPLLFHSHNYYKFVYYKDTMFWYWIFLHYWHTRLNSRGVPIPGGINCKVCWIQWGFQTVNRHVYIYYCSELLLKDDSFPFVFIMHNYCRIFWIQLCDSCETIL